MMGRILAKLLDRKNVDMTNSNEVKNISEKNPDKLSLVQKLVDKDGVFSKFISSEMLNGVDQSYKNQFINWLWVSLADSNEVFDDYVSSFDEHGVHGNSHMITAFIDRVNDFCTHIKKHADFKQRCRDILNKISSKQDHISIEDFCQQMAVMNEEWDAKKKYIVNEQTIDEAWKNIEKKEIHVPGDWGDFHAYLIPSWADLMQTCHQTEWCVAQKGSNGERYYKYYGEPYYLLCNGRRNPFALLNPPSSQFKDVKDYPIQVRSDGNVLPSHRHVILFGKAVLDEVSPGSVLRGDFNCFSNLEKIQQLEDEDRNDKTDYDNLVEKMPEKEFGNAVTNSFLQLVNSEGSGYNWETADKYRRMSEEERNAIIDEVIAGPRTQCVKSWMIYDLVARGEKGRILALLDKNTQVNDYEERSVDWTLASMMWQYVNNFSYGGTDGFSAFDSMDEIVRKMLSRSTDEKERSHVAWYVMVSEKCSTGLLEEIMEQFDFNHLDNSDVVLALLKNIERGRLPKSLFSRIEQKVVGDAGTRFSNTHNQVLNELVSSPLCSESTREVVFNSTNQLFHDSPAFAALKNSEGRLADDWFNDIETKNITRDDLERIPYKLYVAAALENPRCPAELFPKILEAMEYGKGQVIDKYEVSGIWSAMLNSPKITEEQFMKVLKANPKLIVRWGWNSPYCTDAVKLVLARRVGKQNGGIFHFNQDENPLVMNEFFKSRLAAGRYAEYNDALRNDLIPDELLLKAIMTISPGSGYRGDKALEKSCGSKRLSVDSIRYITAHLDEAKSYDTLIRSLYKRSDIPDDVVYSLLEKDDSLHSSALSVYVQWHKTPESRDVISAIASRVFEHGGNENWESLARILLHNPNCPDQYIADVYEKYRKSETDIVAHAIRSGLYGVDKFCNDLSEMDDGYYVDLTEIVKAILASSRYSAEEKTAMLLSMNLSKVNVELLGEFASQCTGEKMFKKIVLMLNHQNSNVGKALAQNENYSQEKIATILNRNYGVVEGYYNRFGVDENILRSKHLYKLIERHFSDFTKNDIKTILHCDNEDAVWLMKKYIKRDNALTNGVVNASRMNALAMRVAMKEEKNDVVAMRVVASLMDNGEAIE